MIYISRIEHFNAAHRLFNPAWSDEQNAATFGPCANPNYHGHNFELIVTVKGEPQPDTGLVMDLKDVAFMQGKIPSCELFVVEIWRILERALADLTEARLHQIRLYETPRNFVDYYGE
jgi:6-pyruvoyltetrahydropterin/6-carboxytetrahydropterin synthase